MKIKALIGESKTFLHSHRHFAEANKPVDVNNKLVDVPNKPVDVVNEPVDVNKIRLICGLNHVLASVYGCFQ